MRFFPPDLYLRFNASDDRVADEANEEWEAAIKRYQHDLSGLLDQLPPGVQKLAKTNLHDAELLDTSEGPEAMSAWPPGPHWTAYSMFFLRRVDEGIALVYQLWDTVRQHPAPDNWPFSKQQVHWLFDEIAAEPNADRVFWHRVLLSDGRVIEIPFVNVLMRAFSLRRREAASA
jgi:hypothetical protein